MPRQPRVLVDGGLYHVYNRTAHGSEVFADPDCGERFTELLARYIRIDGHLVFAWCLMSNHYHVVLRSSAVDLSRTMNRVQSGFGRWRNHGLRSRGPTWEGRYKAKLVADEGYLLQLVAYVHLNPVSANLVHDPADHELSGHREILGLTDYGLVSRDTVLSLYGETEREAREGYVAALEAARQGTGWLRARPGGLPWWKRQIDRRVEPEPPESGVASDGRPARPARPVLGAEEYLEAACTETGTSLGELRSRTRRWAVSRVRFLIVGLGVERWRQSATGLAAALDRRPDLVSWWARRAVELRHELAQQAAAYEELDERLRIRFESGVRG